MKALSIKEPWASMMLSGDKIIETRTWKTNYRGDILLCASKKPISELSGNAFAIGTLINCRPMLIRDVPFAKCEVYPNAYSWVFKSIRPLKKLCPIKGKLGLFTIPSDIVFKLGTIYKFLLEAK